MAEITRAELGIGLLLAYLVTPKGQIIGEVRLPEKFALEISSLKIGKPAFDIKTKETTETTYQEICKIDVPEGGSLSLEQISILIITEPDKAKFKIEIGEKSLEDVQLPLNVAWTGAFRGRVELKTGQRVWIGIKSTDGTLVKGEASIIGVII